MVDYTICGYCPTQQYYEDVARFWNSKVSRVCAVAMGCGATIGSAVSIDVVRQVAANAFSAAQPYRQYIEDGVKFSGLGVVFLIWGGVDLTQALKNGDKEGTRSAFLDLGQASLSMANYALDFIKCAIPHIGAAALLQALGGAGSIVSMGISMLELRRCIIFRACLEEPFKHADLLKEEQIKQVLQFLKEKGEVSEEEKQAIRIEVAAKYLSKGSEEIKKEIENRIKKLAKTKYNYISRRAGSKVAKMLQNEMSPSRMLKNFDIDEAKKLIDKALQGNRLNQYKSAVLMTASMISLLVVFTMTGGAALLAIISLIALTMGFLIFLTALNLSSTNDPIASGAAARYYAKTPSCEYLPGR